MLDNDSDYEEAKYFCKYIAHTLSMFDRMKCESGDKYKLVKPIVGCPMIEKISFHIIYTKCMSEYLKKQKNN